MSRRSRRKYTPEQKADAVRMVQVGNLSKVARDLELTESSLRNWVQQAETDAGRGPEGALTSEEREELAAAAAPGPHARDGAGLRKKALQDFVWVARAV